jgi:hypothetical protein
MKDEINFVDMSEHYQHTVVFLCHYLTMEKTEIHHGHTIAIILIRLVNEMWAGRLYGGRMTET